MKAIFGVLSLLVVLAIVGSLVRKQMSATGLAERGAAAASQAGLGSPPAADSAAVPRIAPDATVRQQAATMQQQARDRTAAALQQGADRNRRAEP